ncbi:Hypothetical predicted protein [Podarcis lilfordi]|uniref:Uncharacterized protein n=1 Tax=Podarcis lilfordi TaxID=74358 RepID=A0AA35KMA5_9SAUR|nr:Hypothetical predicted protein [Podarcis lilfordi]
MTERGGQDDASDWNLAPVDPSVARKHGGLPPPPPYCTAKASFAVAASGYLCKTKHVDQSCLQMDPCSVIRLQEPMHTCC